MLTSTSTLEQHLTESSLLRSENESLKSELSVLKEQLEWFRRQIFGQRSEKVVANLNEEQLSLPGLESPTSQTKEDLQDVPAHKRKKTNRNGKDKITLPENLPVERQVIDLSEEEKICQETGQSLVKIGEEVTRKLAHKPGSFFIKEIIRPKYAASKKNRRRGNDSSFARSASTTMCS